VNKIRELDVFGCPLDGIGLIEASAGTGKTWAICGLYLRLLLERGLEARQILVVTFTKAATAELRERIRQRIADTLAHLRGRGAHTGDPFVPRLVATLRSARNLTDADMVGKLELALATFDEAAIFTIHAFCQRALADTPFSAHMPLAMELLQDDAELVHEAANDFWRRRVAGEHLAPALAALLVKRKDSPEKFARLLKRHLARPTARALWPSGIDAANNVDNQALAAAHAAARALWLAGREAIIEPLKRTPLPLKANVYKAQSVEAAAQGWDELLRPEDHLAALELEPGKIDLLGTTRLIKETKKGETTPSHAFFDAAQTLLDARAACAQSLELTRLRLLRDLLDEASRALRDVKRQRRMIAFDDMLFNLHERLTGGSAPWLAPLLKARYPAALIDEFQDTDPLQFGIFSRVYGDGKDSPLFLVGDPKQAIYGFRNADLHTYLGARARAGAQYTLLENQRSTGPLLDALNGLFGANPAAFMLPRLDYHPVTLGAKPRSTLADATEKRAQLQVWMLPHDPQTGEPLKKNDARHAAARATAAEIARLLAAARDGRITLDRQPLSAGDIAVLVRSHAEGSLMRQALSLLGVGSVELSQASIYRSADAEEIDRLLTAVLEPSREKLLKAALATEAMGLDAADIDALGADEPGLRAAITRFAGYRDTWLARGVGFMLRRWLAEEHVAERMLARPDGERRLTNLLHLAECLHQAAADHPAPDALLRWLQAQRRDERADETTQLRLESDQNLVQIITIHKSKGLEYPIVFCPFVWNGRGGATPDGLDGVAYHDDEGQAVIDYRKCIPGEYAKADVDARVRLEASAESLRLIYVALTRAVHRCVIVAGCYAAGQHASTTESTRSLLNWLVAGAGETPESWFRNGLQPPDIAAAWDRLAARGADALAVAPLPPGEGRPVPATRPAPDMLAALPAPRHLPAGWWIGSYSSLAHGATHEQAAADHDLRVSPDDPASAMDASTAPSEVSATAPPLGHIEEGDILRFPRGAAAGDCLHAVFERVDFTDTADWPAAIAAGLHKLRPSLPLSARHDGAGSPALHARMLQRMLGDVLATPLPVGTARPLLLCALPRTRRLTEMEFHLPSHRLDAVALTDTLRRFGYAVPQLAFTSLRGFLRGFIDMVCEHEGRYFIVDWKSNHLGDTAADYATAPLAAAMARHGYHLQSLLYSVALDRHLRRRLADYAHERHFGGVLYLFVRGLRPEWQGDDGLPAGLHFHRPGTEVIGSLSALLEHGEALA
jgi:exodeoxyribonuclease V beta subunit